MPKRQRCKSELSRFPWSVHGRKRESAVQSDFGQSHYSPKCLGQSCTDRGASRGTFLGHCSPHVFGKGINFHGQIHTWTIPYQHCSVKTIHGEPQNGPQNRDPDLTSGPSAKNRFVVPESFARAHPGSVSWYQWKILIFFCRYWLQGPLNFTLIQIIYKGNTVIFHNMVTVIPLLLKSNCSVIMISMFSDTL